jgi:hypothetical protein
MSQLVIAIRGVLMLNTSVFERMRDAKDGIRRAFLILTFISLVVALPTFINDLFRGYYPQNAANVRVDLKAVTGQFGQTLGPFLDNLDAGLNIGQEIAALPTRLPKPVAVTLKALGRYLSYPFSWIGGWLFYLIWVILVAKLLGGRAGIRQMISATSLHSVPMILNVVGFIACLGPVVQVATFVWGFVIYVKATAVANEFDGPRATLAVVLPFVVLGFVITVGAIGLFTVLALSVARG